MASRPWSGHRAASGTIRSAAEQPAVYICHCRAVTDGRVRAAVDGGARSPAEVARCCGAGTGCGGCLPALRALLAEMGLAEMGLAEMGLIAELDLAMADEHAA
ncbi:MAG: (2Fe-2S)-binding protein [Acidimicrobiales bacterium]